MYVTVEVNVAAAQGQRFLPVERSGRAQARRSGRKHAARLRLIGPEPRLVDTDDLLRAQVEQNEPRFSADKLRAGLVRKRIVAENAAGGHTVAHPGRNAQGRLAVRPAHNLDAPVGQHPGDAVPAFRNDVVARAVGMAAGRVFKNAQDRFIPQLAAGVEIGDARLIYLRKKHNDRSVIVKLCAFRRPAGSRLRTSSCRPAPRNRRGPSRAGRAPARVCTTPTRSPPWGRCSGGTSPPLCRRRRPCVHRRCRPCTLPAAGRV